MEVWEKPFCVFLSSQKQTNYLQLTQRKAINESNIIIVAIVSSVIYPIKSSFMNLIIAQPVLD